MTSFSVHLSCLTQNHSSRNTEKLLLKISLNGSKRERFNPMSPNSDPLLLLTNEALGAEWNQQGLPPDIVSIENGTILVNSERYLFAYHRSSTPRYLLDQREGKEKKNNLQVTRLGNKTLVNTLEMSIEKERLLRTAWKPRRANRYYS